MNFSDLPLRKLTGVIVDVIANYHDSLIHQSHRWTSRPLTGNLMNMARHYTFQSLIPILFKFEK